VTDLELADAPDGVEVVPFPVDLGPWEPGEVLVVSSDEALLAAAPHGVHRLLDGDAASIHELTEIVRRTSESG
jgi:hypothetical protein